MVKILVIAAACLCLFSSASYADCYEDAGDWKFISEKSCIARYMGFTNCSPIVSNNSYPPGDINCEFKSHPNCYNFHRCMERAKQQRIDNTNRCYQQVYQEYSRRWDRCGQQ